LALAVAALSVFPTNTGAVTQDQRCLALNIYFEARGAAQVDKEAVGHVTLNRTKVGVFPKTICGVVYQKGQFSWTTDANSNEPRNPRAWQESQQIADEILTQEVEDVSKGATYFYNHATVRPAWSKRFTVTLQTQAHTYMRKV